MSPTVFLWPCQDFIKLGGLVRQVELADEKISTRSVVLVKRKQRIGPRDLSEFSAWFTTIYLSFYVIKCVEMLCYRTM